MHDAPHMGAGSGAQMQCAMRIAARGDLLHSAAEDRAFSKPQLANRFDLASGEIFRTSEGKDPSAQFRSCAPSIP
jgi:hypothetical protein